MSKRIHFPILLSIGVLTCALRSLAADNHFLGDWELTIPGGAAGWLGVEETNAQLQASLLWGSGSVLPLASAKVENGKLVLTRKHEVEKKDAAGKKSKTTIIETITAQLQGDQ